MVKCHNQKARWELKGSFDLYFEIRVSLKKSGQEHKKGINLEAGADAKAMEGTAYWLPSNGLHSLLSYRI